MHSRVVRIKGDPAKANEGIQNWTQQILPQIKRQKGFAGVSLIVNRKAGEGLSVSYWQTEQAMKEARPQILPTGEKVLATTGSRIIEEDEYEVAVLERFQPPKSGVWVRVTTAQADPAKVSDGISAVKSKGVPLAKKQPGARAFIQFVNRQSGKSLVATIWDTEKDLQNSEAASAALRQELSKQVGAPSPKVEVFEIVYTEILEPALALG